MRGVNTGNKITSKIKFEGWTVY